jgi:hypothetical protein
MSKQTDNNTKRIFWDTFAEIKAFAETNSREVASDEWRQFQDVADVHFVREEDFPHVVNIEVYPLKSNGVGEIETDTQTSFTFSCFGGFPNAKV